jgi:DNA processing protein
VEGRRVTACDDCLRRAELLGILGPRISDLIRPRMKGMRLLLALPDDELVDAVAGERIGEVLAALDRFDAAAMRKLVAGRNLTAVCRHDAAYPERLAQLPDAPSPLFLRGDASLLTEVATTPSVAIVGARKASTYGLEIARELGRGLAVAGVPVVSGLALGIDGASHQGTVAGGGRPLAVLASGADVPYPRSHRGLYAQVAAAGAVISEMPPGTEARRWAFPARNRIMAALAEMVIVVEARMGSGTLITAEFAGDLDCQIGAVPGRVNSAVAALPNKLIVDGARPILGVQDVLDALYGVGARPAPPPLRVSLDRATRSVLDTVEAGDSPLAAREVEIKEVRAALGRLEVLGLVRRDGLGGYERTGVPCEHA